MTKRVVIDACVFAKIYVQEPDREQAIALLKVLGDKDITIVVPQLFFYEIISVSKYGNIDVSHVLQILKTYQKTNLKLLEPDLDMLKTAIAITDSGHPKSGYPSFYDAIYHAMALCLDCMFITADKRYFEKTQQLGKIGLLENWEQIIDK
jgi:predicted nucleic acid-binding protein